MSNRLLQSLTFIILLSMLSACGFRLRGSIELPPAMQQTHIAGVAQYAQLAVQLRRLLSGSGAQVVADGTQASAILQISGEELKKRVLSVDAQGRAAEYELNYRFNFQVVDNENQVLVPSQRVELTRDYRFDPDNVLATGAEEAQILEDMYRFAASQAMRRISATLRQRPN